MQLQPACPLHFNELCTSSLHCPPTMSPSLALLFQFLSCSHFCLCRGCAHLTVSPPSFPDWFLSFSWRFLLIQSNLTLFPSYLFVFNNFLFPSNLLHFLHAKISLCLTSKHSQPSSNSTPDSFSSFDGTVCPQYNVSLSNRGAINGPHKSWAQMQIYWTLLKFIANCK